MGVLWVLFILTHPADMKGRCYVGFTVYCPKEHCCPHRVYPSCIGCCNMFCRIIGVCFYSRDGSNSRDSNRYGNSCCGDYCCLCCCTGWVRVRVGMRVRATDPHSPSSSLFLPKTLKLFFLGNAVVSNIYQSEFIPLKKSIELHHK
jgi:hypothetical protein